MSINKISPKFELQMLILRGNTIETRLRTLRATDKNYIESQAELEGLVKGGIVGLIIEELGPLVKKVTRDYRIAQEIQKLQNEETNIRIDFDQWQKDVTNFLSKVSINRKNLKYPGNSQILINRFHRFNDYIKFETKIRHALVELQKIFRNDLIYNTELKVLQKIFRNDLIYNTELKVLVSKEFVIEPKTPYSTQKLLEDVLSDAQVYVKIIDPWVSVETLDPLFVIKNDVMIKLLCSNTGGKKENRLIKTVKKFKIEKPYFTIKKAVKEEMHDRWIISEKGIWSLTQSIKDIGRKDTIAFIAPSSNQTKKRVELFFDSLWSKAKNLI
jgi:hypothetical protein